MSSSPVKFKAAYQALEQQYQKIAKLSHLEAIVSWDANVMMPAGGATARSEAMAELAVIKHEISTSYKMQDLFEQLRGCGHENVELTSAEHRSLGEMRRDWDMKSIIPATLVEEASLATSKCEHGWRTQRPANNFSEFAPNLARVLDVVRKEADTRKAAGSFASRYDALLDIYEPGLTSSTLNSVFGEVA